MSGYEWVRTKEFPSGREDLFLTPERPCIGGQEGRSYDPLKAEPALFRTFADTEPSHDGIREFANEYGPLSRFGGATARMIYLVHYKARPELPDAGGEAARKSAIRLPRRERTETPGGYGEIFSDWANAIRTMKDAVSLSDGLRLRDMERIASTLEAKDFAPQFWVPKMELPKNPIGIASRAQSCLHHMISTALSRQLSIELTEGLHVTMSDLLPTLWLQFAIALENSTAFRRCIQCAKWFAASNSGNQIERIYCSSGCRTRAYRVRKTEQATGAAIGTELAAEAWNLYSDGLWLDEIAKRLGVDPVVARKAIVRRQLLLRIDDNYFSLSMTTTL